jgi:microcystin-dependent protein
MYYPGEIRTFAFGARTEASKKLWLDGWLPCDGRAVPIIYYPDLFSAIGFSWGTELETSNFCLPDYSGAFLRGVTLSSNSKDPEYVGRLAPRPDLSLPGRRQGNAGNEVGSYQSHAFEQHEHAFVALQAKENGAGDSSPQRWLGGIAGRVTDKSGGSETRPVNYYVLYMIYVKEYKADIVQQVERDYQIT